MPLYPITKYRGDYCRHCQCIQAAGGCCDHTNRIPGIIIAALTDFQIALQGGGTGTQSVAALAPGTSGEALTKG